MKILILCLIAAINGQSSEIYTCTRDVNIAASLNQSGLIASYRTQNSVLCLGACNRNPQCSSCSYSRETTITSDDCYLYNRVFTSNDYYYAINVDWYSKRVLISSTTRSTTTITSTTCNSSLMFYFTNTTLNSNITSYNGTTFSALISTEMAIVNNTPVYFLADYYNNALITMSETWQYIKTVNFTRPRAIKWANDHLYVSSLNGFHKTDYNFNIIKSIVDTGAGYTGIYHNSSDNILAVAVWWRYRVDWIDAANLTVLSNVNFVNYRPVSVFGNGGSLYVSALSDTTSTLIYVIRNRVIINTLSISNTTAMYIWSIVFDDCGYMALSFEYQRIVQLYHINGTSTGLALTLAHYVYQINFDFNKRMMISTWTALFFLN